MQTLTGVNRVAKKKSVQDCRHGKTPRHSQGEDDSEPPPPPVTPIIILEGWQRGRAAFPRRRAAFSDNPGSDLEFYHRVCEAILKHVAQVKLGRSLHSLASFKS